MGGSSRGPGGNQWGGLRGKIRQELGGLALHGVQGEVGNGCPGVISVAHGGDHVGEAPDGVPGTCSHLWEGLPTCAGG